jgi:hypothetical protein
MQKVEIIKSKIDFKLNDKRTFTENICNVENFENSTLLQNTLDLIIGFRKKEKKSCFNGLEN